MVESHFGVAMLILFPTLLTNCVAQNVSVMLAQRAAQPDKRTSDGSIKKREVAIASTPKLHADLSRLFWCQVSNLKALDALGSSPRTLTSSDAGLGPEKTSCC
jgi:hypothetical protein